MQKSRSIPIVLLVLFASAILADEREENYFKQQLMPMARQFVSRNNLPLHPDFDVKAVKKFKVEFMTNRPVVISSISLTNRYTFDILEGTNGVKEVIHFRDSSVKTYYDLSGASPEKIEAMRGLNRKNKLNEASAKAMVQRLFLLQGHKEENFQSVELRQMRWGNKGDPDYVLFPFYEAEWYRKDVTNEDRESGKAIIPHVRIEISGITSSLIYYSKAYMPIGSDFEK